MMPAEKASGDNQRWSWELAERINASKSLKEALTAFLGGLSEQYDPLRAGVCLLEAEGWREIASLGAQTWPKEEELRKLLQSLVQYSTQRSADIMVSGMLDRAESEGCEDSMLVFSIHHQVSHLLLGACCVLLTGDPPRRVLDNLMIWVNRFSGLLALHISCERDNRRFEQQKVALNLLLAGANILTSASDESRLFAEAGEMAMGILQLDKGIFLVQDVLDPEKVWVRGFGRMKGVDESLERSALLGTKGGPCEVVGVSEEGTCRDCPLFDKVCRGVLEDISPGWMFRKYPLTINGGEVGELRVLHGENELIGLDHEIVNTFMAQISVALETLRHRAALERLATHDPLTGLLNRTGLEERLEAECARAARMEEKLLFVVLDLDHFKQVNDTLGHPAGDQLLIKVGHALTASVRTYDLVSRLGGDEFVVVFSRWEESSISYSRVQAWMKGLEQSLPEIGIAVGFSAGVARFPEQKEFRALYQRADEALYRAKETGRHRICGLEPTGDCVSDGNLK